MASPVSSEITSSDNMQDFHISRPLGLPSPINFDVNDTGNCNLHHNKYCPVNQPATDPLYIEMPELFQMCQRTVEFGTTKKHRKLDSLESTTTITTSSSSASPSLPHLLILDHILTRLPPKYLLQCSCVCKLWYTSILHDPHFAASHFLQYSQKNPRLLYMFGGQGEVDSFYLSSGGKESKDEYVDLHQIGTIGSEHKRELIGSCNGLICLFDLHNQIIELCNPTRRQTLAIFPPYPIMADDHQPTKSCRFGFGYDSLSAEYKVAVINLEMSECMVFSLGTNNSYWKEIAIDKDVLSKLSDVDDCFQSGGATFCNGALYWSQAKELVSFHLHKEEFQVIQLPCLPRFHGLFSSRLLVHKGSLCYANMSAVCKSFIRWSVELFVLKDEGCKLGWKKEVFPLPYCSPDLSNQLVDFHDQLLLHRTVTKGQIRIFNLHRRKDKIIRNPCNLSNVEHWVCSSHIENFLSLQTFLQHGDPYVEAINF